MENYPTFCFFKSIQFILLKKNLLKIEINIKLFAGNPLEIIFSTYKEANGPHVF